MPESGSAVKREFTRRDFFMAGALMVGTLSAVGTYLVPGGSTPSSVTIRYLTGADSSGARDLLVSMWNEANPRAGVQIVEVGGASTFDQLNGMIVEMEAGRADVLNVDTIHIPRLRTGELISPLQLDGVEDFLPNTLLTSRAVDTTAPPSGGTGAPAPTADPGKEKYWAAPYSADVGMIFQRLASDAPAGNVPTLADLVDRIVPEGSGQFTEQLQPAGNRSREALVVNVLEHALSRDASILDAETGMPALSLDRWQAALRPLRTALIRNKIVGYDTEDSCAAAFRERRMPYMRNWPVRYRNLQLAGDRDSLTGRVRLGALPNGVLGGGSLVVAANAPQSDRAQDFVRFMTGVPAQKILAQLAVPPARSAAYDERLKTFVPHILGVRDAAENARPRPISPCYQKFSDVAFTHFAAFVRGTDLPASFIDDVERSLACQET